jgi:uncharacterized protein YjbI with pentapeptide repeats
MASKRELRQRWTTAAGKVAARAIDEALGAGADLEEMAGYLRMLPLVGEVAPAMDLRGVALPELIAVRTRDLRGTRFDGARINWSFSGCALADAVFDGCEGKNVDFGGCDLSRASFVGARLPGAVFFGADLQRADLTRISMRGGQLKDANCGNALLRDSDLRLVWAAGADLRGADLRGADLTGASLGQARWDSETRFEGAALTWEGTPDDMQAQAFQQGATLGSEKPEWQMSLFDATRRMLEAENRDGKLSPVLERLDGLRRNLERDHSLLWATRLKKGLDEEQWNRVQTAVRKAASNIGALLE